MPNKPVTIRRWEMIAVFLILIASYAGGLLKLHYQSQTIRHQAHIQCVSLEHVKSYAHQAALRGLATLPTLAYYKEHPDELADAQKNLLDEIAYFAPDQCP